MSDESVNVTTAEGVAPGATKQGFFSTPQGRIVAIVGGLLVLGIVAGVAAAIILNIVNSGDTAGELVPSTPPAASAETTASAPDATTVEAAGPAAEVRNSEVFTFRNIFEPLIKPLPEPAVPTPGTGTPSTTDTETPYAQGVLYLERVVSEDGVSKAVLRYNGQTYTLAAGEGLPGTPWEVFSVSSTSVTMLYGDVRVTLAVGQGITK
ncbi:MAG: hypothetical protein ACYC2X_01080 [Coriobacteriia bacterium]